MLFTSFQDVFITAVWVELYLVKSRLNFAPGTILYIVTLFSHKKILIFVVAFLPWIMHQLFNVLPVEV